MIAVSVTEPAYLRCAKIESSGKFLTIACWLIFTMASSIPVATVIKSCVKAFFGFEKISKTDPSSISSPFCMTATRLAISLTICISWVIKTMVKPSFLFNSCNKARICLVVFGSKAEVDSSEIKIFGSLARARAIATRCF